MSATAPPKGTALEILQRHESALSNETRDRWALEQLVTVWNTVAEGATFGEFAMFISLADKYDLNPLAHEIWFGKNKKSGKVMIMVGRDGLLTIARRTQDFRTVRGDVHRKNDHFKVIHLPDGTDTVEHSYEGSAEDRGEIVGSWAQVVRIDGSMTNFTYCPLSEYMPESPGYGSAWLKTTSAMIQKCSVSLALRIAYGISGVVGEDEVAGQVVQSLTDAEGTGDEVAEEIELPAEVTAIISRAEELGNTTWTDQNTWKYRVTMGGEMLSSAIAQAHSSLDRIERMQGAEPTEADVVDEDLGDGQSSPFDEAGPCQASSDTADGSATADEPVAQESLHVDAPPIVRETEAEAELVLVFDDPDSEWSPIRTEEGDSEEMRALKAKRQYVASMEAVGDEEEAQKDEAIEMIDEQIMALRLSEAP